MKLPKLPVTVYAFAAFAVVIGLSFIAGQCRKYRTPDPPKVIEGKVDAGVPPPGPVNEAPTLQESLTVDRPDLTREEVIAKAKEYGMAFHEKTSTGSLGKGKGSIPVSAESADFENQAPPKPQFPYLLAEETFGPGPAGDKVDVSAWVEEWGGRVNLRSKWRDYQPPPKPWTSGPPIACPSTGFFENRAQWEGSVGYGAVAGAEGVGLGPFGSVGYLGPRTGALTWGVGGFAGWSNASGLVAAGGARVTF